MPWITVTSLPLHRQINVICYIVTVTEAATTIVPCYIITITEAEHKTDWLHRYCYWGCRSHGSRSNASVRYSAARVSFETSFDLKQPKLEPKLVSALSETKRLFRLFRFYTETESFDVSIESLNRNKQKTNRNSLIGSIFYRKFRVFPFFLGFLR